MNLKTRFPLLFVVLLAALVLAGCGGYSPVQGSLVMGDVYTLEEGETLNDDLTVMGGVATLAEGTTVNGDVSVLGGTLDVYGTINGDLSVMGGAVDLKDTAVVQGNVSRIGGSVNRDDGARVGGSFDSNRSRIDLPRGPRMSLPFDPFAPLVTFFNALAVAALAVLISLFALRPMDRVGQAIQSQPVITGGIGLLTLIVAPALLVILAITIILLPISLLGFLLIGIAMVFGWVSVGLLIGRQIARWTNQTWSDPINAGVGTLALSLVASLFNAIPCIGWMANFIIAILGLGAVIVTRFGMQSASAAGTGFGGFGGPAAAPRYTPPPAPAPAPYPYPETRYEGPEGVARNTVVGPDPRALDPDFLGDDQPASGNGADDALKPPAGRKDDDSFTPEI